MYCTMAFLGHAVHYDNAVCSYTNHLSSTTPSCLTLQHRGQAQTQLYRAYIQNTQFGEIGWIIEELSCVNTLFLHIIISYYIITHISS